MAQPIPCDLCNVNEAVQMLTNLDTGQVMTMCPACIPAFYGHSLLTVIDAGEHKGPAGKCQACRRVHERMTTPVAPIGVAQPDGSTYSDEPVPDTAEVAES